MKTMAPSGRTVCCVIAALFAISGSAWALESVALEVPIPSIQGQKQGVDLPSPAPEPTSEVLVFLEAGTDAQAFAQEHGLTFKYALRSNSDACVFEASSAAAAESFVAEAGSNAHVQSAYLNVQTQAVTMAFVPDDPYFPKDTPEAGWPGQWHLVNQHTAGLDAGVQGAWNRDITGSGVTIGIVDVGIETTHPDLSANYVAADSWDFGEDDDTPDPVYSDDDHGTSVAGVAAARGGNGTGVTGAAPEAGIAGLRVDFQNQETAQFVDATLYHSNGSNTSIKVKNHSYGYNGTFIDGTAEQDALETSADCGTIHTWSAGNSRKDANKWDILNSPAALTVAALGSDGKFASYSNYGADVFVTAPSSTTGGYGITTTDRTGHDGYNSPSQDGFPDDDYTSIFGGTSSAAPLVAGVMALGLQVQPALDIRFAKHLLVESCVKVDAGDSTYESDGGWQMNGAGHEFNQNYGFGLVNADAFTEKAAEYLGVSALTTDSYAYTGLNFAIPDNTPGTIWGFAFDVTATEPLEEVMLTVDIEHTWRGDLQLFIRSPSDTLSRVLHYDGADFNDDIDWTFLTNAFWGEDPEGEWAVFVQDVFYEDTGTWHSFDLELRMGHLVGVPEPATLTLLALGGVLLLKTARRRRLLK